MTASACDIIDGPAAPPGGATIPHGLELTLRGRRPPVMRDETERFVAAMSVPVAGAAAGLRSPPATVVVVTYNNLPFTKLCLASVIENTPAGDYELVVVDNGSTDGTGEYLRELAAANVGLVHVVVNPANRGFAAANNQALALASGGVLVLLNNDTVVPPGWLGGLVRHVEGPEVGLVGPVTNRIGNEAEVDASYRTYGEMLRFAAARAAEERGRSFDIPVPCMFCLAMRRDAYEAIGPLDERFEVGLLEDDDYARRAHAAGYRTACAEDVFVHHFGQASFGGLVPTGEYGRILAANRRRFEEKWGEPWKPYERRASASYQAMAERLRRVVGGLLPRGAVVAVISKGDEALVRFDGISGRHFPQGDDGGYAGHYPADGDEAVALLERARGLGAQYLLVPATALWWLGHYPRFAAHLETRCDRVFAEAQTCHLYSLTEGPGGGRLAEAGAPPAEIGSRDYRAFVGPPDKYDLVAAAQFGLLTCLGLREHHCLLDVGCGSLRAGRLFIPYLLPGRYFGIEPEAWLVREGLERELGRDVERLKRPAFIDDRDFTLTAFGRAFDFLLAQSVFSHAAPAQVSRCLAQAARVMKPRAVFAATFCEGDSDYDGAEWVYPQCVLYRFARLEALAREQGLECRRVDWPHPNGQKWVVFVRPDSAPYQVVLAPPESMTGGLL